MKFVSTTIFLLFALGANAQNILLVDNTPSAPGGSHVYSTIQEAIDASSPGDIIHVKPSATSYGNIQIEQDSITIYGIGLNPDKEIFINSTVGSIQVNGVQNIKISGLVVTGGLNIAYNIGSCANLSFENCLFNSTVYVSYSYSTSNVLFRNCIIEGQFITDATKSNNTVVNNCIFAGYNGNAQVQLYNGTLVSHCLFFGAGTYTAFGYLLNSTVSNSIFFGKSAQASTSTDNSTFNNCLSIGNSNNTFPTTGGNSVNGTITSISGNVFADAAIVVALDWNINWDPTLDPTSIELIGTGDDGTDIGLTGGTIPFNNKAAALPYIKSLVVPSVIKQGDDLNVTINALGN